MRNISATIRDMLLGAVVVVGIFLIVTISDNSLKVSNVIGEVTSLDTNLSKIAIDATTERSTQKILLERIAAKQDSLMLLQDSLIQLLVRGLN